jgi:hypothetical protein
MTRRPLVGAGAALAALVVLVLLVGAPSEGGRPFDPRSTSPDGAKGLVLVLERLGAEVRTATTAGEAGAAVVLDDRLDEGQRDELLDWVAGGGTLVVADPASPLTPVVDDVVDGSRPQGACDVAALAAVGTVDVGDAVAYDVPSEAEGSCFGDGDAAFVVVQARGDGTLVSIGGADALLNERLDEADNAVLAAALLAPSPGTVVSIVEAAPTVGEGEETLLDLVSPGAKRAVLQLAVAFVLYALWRARRLGRPVEESQPVDIAGSELVDAVGQLLHQRRDPQRAAAVLQRDIRRRAAGLVGLPPDAPTTALGDALASRAGVDRDDVHAVLSAQAITDDRQLVELAERLDAIRQEVTHGQR